MKRIEELTLLQRLYFVEVMRGILVTGGHTVSNFCKLAMKFVGITAKRGIATYQYPDERRAYATRYRGRHRLTLREDGSAKCTSCLLCATACPAKCIYIEPVEHTDCRIEKVPARYEIDTLLCVYCGYCVDACPVDAIRMDTGIHPEIYSPSDTRSFIEDKETLVMRSRNLEKLGHEEIFKQHLDRMKSIEKAPFAVKLSRILLPLFLAQSVFVPTAYSEKLPSPDDPLSGSRYISSGNVKEFQKFLLAPLAQMVSEKKLIIKTADSLGYEWNYSREWVAASEANTNRFEIDANGAVRSPDGLPLIFGFPFSMDMIETTVLDPALRAQMIVLNTQSLGSIGGGVLYRGGYIEVGPTGLFRRSNFSLLRLFDSRTEQAQETEGILFREMFSFIAPSVIRGFSIATTRYQSGLDDLVELYSPVLKGARKVTEVNRADAILDGNLSLDDFLVFSENPKDYSWRLVEKKKMYIPFVGDVKLLAEESVLSDQIVSDIKPAYTLDAGGPVSAKCVKGPYSKSDSNRDPKATTNGSSNGAMVNWRFESTGSDYAARSSFASWAPLSPIFLNRDVWVIEVFPRNPFYQYGKQVLFIDAQPYLPVYRLVYDRRGSYQKLLMAAWSLVSDSSTKNQVPVLGFLLGVDKSNKNASIFEIGQMCFGLRGKLFAKPGLFNFDKYKPVQQKSVTDKPTKAPEEEEYSEDAGRD